MIKINKVRIRLSMIFRKSIFKHLIAHVISAALKKIMFQYELLIEQFTIILFCIDVFIIITDLSCSHKIQKRLFAKNELLLNNVHFY